VKNVAYPYPYTEYADSGIFSKIFVGIKSNKNRFSTYIFYDIWEFFNSWFILYNYTSFLDIQLTECITFFQDIFSRFWHYYDFSLFSGRVWIGLIFKAPDVGIFLFWTKNNVKCFGVQKLGTVSYIGRLNKIKIIKSYEW